MTEHNKSQPTELQRLKHRLANLAFLSAVDLVLPFLFAVLGMLSTLAASWQSFFKLKALPTVYLVIIAIAVGLAIALLLALVLYRWRVAARQKMIRDLRTTEAELFRSIDARLPDLLGGKL
jgi:uncharacterized membrane protein (DUF106 family)